jgi:PAS domain S-box-containing protein
MNDEDKSKEDLLRELEGLRQRLAAMDAAEATRRKIEDALKDSWERYRQFEDEDLAGPDILEATQTIHIDGFPTQDLTLSGSFSFGGLDETWFGKLINALPLPALLLDDDFAVAFANSACARISPDYREVVGRPFSSLFSNEWMAGEAVAVAQKVFSTRRRECAQGILEIGTGRVWGRMYMRSIRMSMSRLVLILIEDLTLEKEQLLLKQKHEEEILRERVELENRVQERTAELTQANRKLRDEIQERERAEKALRESEAKYRLLVENSPVGIVSCDVEGNISELNPAVLEILGLTSLELSEGMNLLGFSSITDPKFSAAIRKCLDAGEPSVNEFPFRSSWGKQAYIRLHVGPLWGNGGRVTGAQAVIEDISDHKKAEGLLLRSERLKALVEMADAVANNFSNSVRLVAADAQMAVSSLESGNPDEIRPSLERICDNAQKAVLTVRRLRQFASTRTAIGISSERVFDFGQAAREGIEKSKTWWKTNPEKLGVNINLVSELAEGCSIEGSQSEVVEVVVNLIRNAAEALPAGGEIRVRVLVEDSNVVLQVQDDGIGIPKKNFGKIFEPFWTSKGSQPGMGLAVSAGIIRRHRGTVSVISKERKGSTFTVRFPQAGKPAEATEAVAGIEADRNLRVLIIDREGPALRALEAELKTLGHAPVAATSSEQAVSAVEGSDIDAVVCATDLETGDGWDACAAIHTACVEKGLSKLPFVMLAEQGDKSARETLMDHPEVDRLIERPVETEKLIELISGEVATRAAPATFSGNIYGIDILEYLQLLLMTKQQVVVEIVSTAGLKGFLYIDRGEVRHAACGNLEGEDALFRCLNFEGGSFTSLPWREPEKVTIDKPGEFLLFEAARKRDETPDGRFA